MFVRITKVRRAGKVYEYPQLVESFRRKSDGRPTSRVVASLKGWSPEAIENLRVALAASTAGSLVIPVDRSLGEAAERHLSLANLDYLPLAVGSAVWERWGLGRLLDGLLPATSIVDHSRVIEALVLHRCVAPDSKLAACSWYPKTALPELFGVKARYFNNSRVHRALDALSQVEVPLQDALCRRVKDAGEGVVATFLDLTDTWFVGRGPQMSRHGKTKEGLVKEKVGIALLCDQRGYPLRWKTVQGCRYEPSVMLEVLKEAVEGGAVDQQAVVMDRAMGRGAHLDALIDLDVPFVTALVRPEFARFVEGGPWTGFGDTDTSGTGGKRQLNRLRRFATDAGMTAMSDGRFYLDFGVAVCARAEPKPRSRRHGLIARLLKEVIYIEGVLAGGWAPTVQAVADAYGVHRCTLQRLLRLRKLTPQLRHRVLRGDAADLHIGEITAVADLPGPAQDAALDEVCARVSGVDRPRAAPTKLVDVRQHSTFVRRVVWFSPDLCVRRQATALRQLEAVHRHVEGINEKELSRPRKRVAAVLAAEARTFLKRFHLVDLFDITTIKRQTGHGYRHQVVLTRNEDNWRRRRSLDGFGVIAAHSDLTLSPESLVRLYFSKDVVEKDFQAIKSEFELRPVHHQTDAKIKAHVSLCMMALLLHRTVDHTLREEGVALTAGAAVEAMKHCHLNRMQPPSANAYYSVTQATPQQRQIVEAMGLPELLDDRQIERRLTPR